MSKFEKVSQNLEFIISRSDDLISEYNLELILEFINNKEYSLAFEGCLYPYYVEGHHIDDDVREKVMETAVMLGIELPTKKVL